jgi:prepilin-type N-terminal cleavage/methylation domain-containing protein
MSIRRLSHRLAQRGDQRGFTLVELLVAMMIFGLLGGILMTTVIATNNSVQSTRKYTDMTEEARVAVNRLARDLREAQTIDATYPAAGDGRSGITFEADFNNDGSITTTGNDPEKLTYCYQNNQLLISAGAFNCDSTFTGEQLVADHVTAFALTYSSSFSANNIGTETWSQVDAAGDANNILDAGEWGQIDTITISLTVAEGTHSASYATTVNLRNR